MITPLSSRRKFRRLLPGSASVNVRITSGRKTAPGELAATVFEGCGKIAGLVAFGTLIGAYLHTLSPVPTRKTIAAVIAKTQGRRAATGGVPLGCCFNERQMLCAIQKSKTPMPRILIAIN